MNIFNDLQPTRLISKMHTLWHQASGLVEMDNVSEVQREARK